jgi:hypothetical protein
MNSREEKLVNCRVTYTLAHEGKFYIVENVPARQTQRPGSSFSHRLLSSGCRKRFLGRQNRTESLKRLFTNTQSSSNGNRPTRPSNGAAGRGPLMGDVIQETGVTSCDCTL